MLLTNKVSLLRQALDEANSYEEWKEIALELDRVSGLDLWKLDNASEHYNHDLIRDRLMQLRQLMRQKDPRTEFKTGLYVKVPGTEAVALSCIALSGVP